MCSLSNVIKTYPPSPQLYLSKTYCVALIAKNEDSRNKDLKVSGVAAKAVSENLHSTRKMSVFLFSGEMDCHIESLRMLWPTQEVLHILFFDSSFSNDVSRFWGLTFSLLLCFYLELSVFNEIITDPGINLESFSDSFDKWAENGKIFFKNQNQIPVADICGPKISKPSSLLDILEITITCSKFSQFFCRWGVYVLNYLVLLKRFKYFLPYWPLCRPHHKFPLQSIPSDRTWSWPQPSLRWMEVVPWCESGKLRVITTHCHWEFIIPILWRHLTSHGFESFFRLFLFFFFFIFTPWI